MLIERLEAAMDELDADKVAWAYKDNINKLKDRAAVLHLSLSNVEESDKEAIEESAEAYLKVTQVIIDRINKGDFYVKG